MGASPGIHRNLVIPEMCKLKLICMSFDGEYKTEHPVFDSIEDAIELEINK